MTQDNQYDAVVSPNAFLLRWTLQIIFLTSVSILHSECTSAHLSSQLNPIIPA